MPWWYNKWQRESKGTCSSACAMSFRVASLLDFGRSECGLNTPRGVDRAAKVVSALHAAHAVAERASLLGLLRRLDNNRPKSRESRCSRCRRHSSSSDAGPFGVRGTARGPSRQLAGPPASRSAVLRSSARPRKPSRLSKFTAPFSSWSKSNPRLSQKDSSSSVLLSKPRLSRMHGSWWRGTLCTSVSTWSESGQHNSKASRNSRSRRPWHIALEA
mmetsp:Transcript_26249/g.61208  ORF Transcript_26249/g.61208 Transcript_26249/m.61208 type:complete len:216 (+) Transcript_26249:921-1568(+)